WGYSYGPSAEAAETVRKVAVRPDQSRGELDSAVRQQSAIARIGRLGLQNVQLDEVLAASLESVASIVDVPLCSLLAWNEARSDFAVHAAWMADRFVPKHRFEGVRLPGGTESLPGFAVLRGELVRSDDLANDRRFDAKA